MILQSKKYITNINNEDRIEIKKQKIEISKVTLKYIINLYTNIFNIKQIIDDIKLVFFSNVI